MGDSNRLDRMEDSLRKIEEALRIIHLRFKFQLNAEGIQKDNEDSDESTKMEYSEADEAEADFEAEADLDKPCDDDIDECIDGWTRDFLLEQGFKSVASIEEPTIQQRLSNHEHVNTALNCGYPLTITLVIKGIGEIETFRRAAFTTILQFTGLITEKTALYGGENVVYESIYKNVYGEILKCSQDASTSMGTEDCLGPECLDDLQFLTEVSRVILVDKCHFDNEFVELLEAETKRAGSTMSVTVLIKENGEVGAFFKTELKHNQPLLEKVNEVIDTYGAAHGKPHLEGDYTFQDVCGDRLPYPADSLEFLAKVSRVVVD